MNEKRKNKQKEKDYYFPVLVSQIVCCVLVSALFFFIKTCDGADRMLNTYSLLLQHDFLTQKTESAVATVKDYLFSDKGAFAVSGNKVVPYNQAGENVPQNTDGNVQLPSAENKAVFSSANVSEINLKYNKESNDAILLPAGRKGIIFPVEKGRYTSYFGARQDPFNGEDDYHYGIDIGADAGEKIRAVYDATVKRVGYDDISGNFVLLDHQNGYETLYCHCSKVLVTEDTVIRQGETIALVGSTGYSTGPHLHFEIRLDNRSIDPLPFLENAV